MMQGSETHKKGEEEVEKEGIKERAHVRVCCRLCYSLVREAIGYIATICLHAVWQRECNFDMIFSPSQGTLRKRDESKAEALPCVGVFQQAKLKTVNRQ
eukprot:6189907-Pleurochrysis_carterae.AAC.1